MYIIIENIFRLMKAKGINNNTSSTRIYINIIFILINA